MSSSLPEAGADPRTLGLQHSPFDVVSIELGSEFQRNLVASGHSLSASEAFGRDCHSEPIPGHCGRGLDCSFRLSIGSRLTPQAQRAPTAQRYAEVGIIEFQRL